MTLPNEKICKYRYSNIGAVRYSRKSALVEECALLPHPKRFENRLELKHSLILTKIHLKSERFLYVLNGVIGNLHPYYSFSPISFNGVIKNIPLV